MLNFSASEENYIKSIFHLQSVSGRVTTNELANTLKTKPASVTDMLKKLKSKKLLHYQRYRGFYLSSEGKKIALGIIRRHRLWEYFLAEKLKFKWDEVHDVAEQLEHIRSSKLTEKLDEFLGFPKTDPHGDPIPDKHGRLEAGKQFPLTDWPAGQAAVVSHVGDQSSEILELLKHRKINIGSRLEVKKKFSYDLSVEIKVGKLSPFTISHQLAKNIFVQPL